MEDVLVKLQDFHEEFFNSLRREEFCDVTLLGDDKIPVLAHKMILASSSSFFRKLFEAQGQSEVVIHVDGLSAEDLQTVLHVMYHKNTDWKNVDIARVLKLSKYLHLDFMSEVRTESFISPPAPVWKETKVTLSPKLNYLKFPDYETTKIVTSTKPFEQQLDTATETKFGEVELEDFDPELFEKCVENLKKEEEIVPLESVMQKPIIAHPEVASDPGWTVTEVPEVASDPGWRVTEVPKVVPQPGRRVTEVPSHFSPPSRRPRPSKWIRNSYWSEEQEEMINTSMDTLAEIQSNGTYLCKVCYQTKSKRTHMSCHLETHLPNLQYICKFCGEIKRTSNAYRKHIISFHNK